MMLRENHAFRQIIGVQQKASSFVALAIGSGCRPQYGNPKILTRTSLVNIPETNMAPENQWLEEEFPFRAQPIFRGALAVSFWEGSIH